MPSNYGYRWPVTGVWGSSTRGSAEIYAFLVAFNAVGDLLSSLLVSFLWSAVSVGAAFSLSAFLFFLRALIVLRLSR